MEIYFDRSRVTCGQTCMRKRWLNYHYNGTGITRCGFALAPQTGTQVHEGIDSVIIGHGVDDAVAGTLEGYRQVVDERGPDLLQMDPDTEAKWQVEIAEQYDLVEAIVRTWAAIEWPRAMEVYETLGVEREELCHFPMTVTTSYDGPAMKRPVLVDNPATVVLMARADWIVRRKSDGSIFIVNFKTVADAGRSWREQWRYDMQTLSECLAVEERLCQCGHDREWHDFGNGYCTEPPKPQSYANDSFKAIESPLKMCGCTKFRSVKLGGVIIQGLLKGKRMEYPQGSGKYEHNSPLIRCWYRAGEPPMTEPEFYPLSRYEYDCVEPHKMGNGRSCSGGKHHRLSGVRKALVRDVYPGGIAAWIDWLAANDPEVLESQIVILDPILRSDWEIERWKRQTLRREVEIAAAAERINAMEDGPEKDAAVDEAFPMHTGDTCSNDYGRTCSYADICWGSAQADPLGSGLFQIREANHSTEPVRDLVP